MRRTDREITDRQELLDVMARCDVCRLALNDESGYPYVVPLNFGMEERDGTLHLLFHGAMTGTKYDRMERDSRATFEMDCGHQLMTAEQASANERFHVKSRGKNRRLVETGKSMGLGAGDCGVLFRHRFRRSGDLLLFC